MTYKDFQDGMMEKHDLSKSDVNKFLMKFGLSAASWLLGVVILISATVGSTIALFLVSALVVVFVMSLDYFVEDETAYKRILSFSKFWWLGLILALAIVIVLKLTYFM